MTSKQVSATHQDQTALFSSNTETISRSPSTAAAATRGSSITMWSCELTIRIFRIPVAKVNLLVYQMQLQYCNLSSLIGYVGILETSQIRNN